MNFTRVISNILNHPFNRQHKLKAFQRFIKWQLASKILNYPVIVPFTDKTWLIIKKGMTGATGNYYCGLHDFEDMVFLMHFLRKEDLFIDVGANIGSYTILSSGHVGANTISVEPVPSTFKNLMNNIAINHILPKVKPLNIALGHEKTELLITSTYDTINNIKYKEEEGTVKVTVDTLDNIIEPDHSNILLKIDVEGFEAAVLKGSNKLLSNPAVKAIIMELNGLGEQYGFDEKEMHHFLLQQGFNTYSYSPYERKLTPKNKLDINNTLYIRNEEFVKKRLSEAVVINIAGQQI